MSTAELKVSLINKIANLSNDALLAEVQAFLEDKENRISALKREIQKGLDSGWVKDFNPDEQLRKTKAKHAAAYWLNVRLRNG